MEYKKISHKSGNVAYSFGFVSKTSIDEIDSMLDITEEKISNLKSVLRS
jgi:hypothetical protein